MSASDQVTPEDQTSTSASGGPIMFVLCFIMFVAGLILMGMAFNDGSGLIFGAGMTLSSVAFIIPLSRKS